MHATSWAKTGSLASYRRTRILSLNQFSSPTRRPFRNAIYLRVRLSVPHRAADDIRPIATPVDKQKGGVWCCGSATLVSFLHPTPRCTTRSTKSPRNPPNLPKRTFFGDSPPTSPLARSASERNSTSVPRVRRSLISRFWSGPPDSTVALDENDTRASRVVFQGKTDQDQGLPAQETPTTGSVAGGDEHGNGSTSECF